MRKLLPLLLLLCFCSYAFAQDSTQTARRVVVGVTNEGVTGTTANRLAKLTGAPSKAIIVSDGDTDGAIGVVVSNGSTSGAATVQVAGLVNCVFDNATAANDYVTIAATGGRVHDAGATYPATGQVIGQVLSTNGAAGTYQIHLLLRRGSPATALADPGGNGYVVRTGAGVTAARTLTGTTNQVSVTNGDGSVGNPVFSLPQNIHTGASPQFLALGLGGAAPANGVAQVEAAAPAGVASSDLLYADSTAHRWKANNNNGGAVQLVQSGADINTSDQVTATHLAAALPVNQGGTGTTSTLTGLMRGSGTAMTAAELSGDATTSGSNAVTLSNNATARTDIGLGTAASPQFAALGLGVSAPSLGIEATEGTAPAGAASNDFLYPDSTAHRLKMNNNNGGATSVAGASDPLSFFAATTSAQFFGVISDESGTGVVPGTDSPVFTTQITTPKALGGSAAGSTLILQSTSGTGTATTAGVQIAGGTNGGTTVANFLNNGNVGINTSSPVFDSDAAGRYFSIDGGSSSFGDLGVGGNQSGTSAAIAEIGFFNSNLGTAEKRNAFITARNDNATNSGKIQIGTASAGTLSINLTIDHFGNFVAAGTAPTVASTGTGSSPTNTVDTGDNDFVGTITVTAGTAPSSSGTVTLTFAGTLGTNAPVCQWTLGNGTGTFNARATAINGTQSTSSSVVNWDNNAVNLTATSTYKFNYNCTGK